MNKVKRETKILILLHDCHSTNDELTDMELQCFTNRVQLLVCWSFEEAGLYLRQLKASENKTQKTLQKRSVVETPFEEAKEVLSSIKNI